VVCKSWISLSFRSGLSFFREIMECPAMPSSVVSAKSVNSFKTLRHWTDMGTKIGRPPGLVSPLTLGVSWRVFPLYVNYLLFQLKELEIRRRAVQHTKFTEKAHKPWTSCFKHDFREKNDLSYLTPHAHIYLSRCLILIYLIVRLGLRGLRTSFSKT
jgi:hypothetical protein